MKRFLYILFTFIVAYLIWEFSRFLLGSYFILPDIMAKYLPFKESPILSGGEIALKFFDDINDTKEYSFPDNEKFKKHNKDIVDIEEYTVYLPYGGILDKYYWHIDLKLKKIVKNQNYKNGFDLIKGKIYIDLPDIQNGGKKPHSIVENITFEENFSWDYLIEFSPDSANLICFENGEVYPVNVITLNNFIRFRLPMVPGITKNITKEKMGKHIVGVSLYSDIEKSGFYSFSENPEKYSIGGGKNYKNSSVYFDLVCQQEIEKVVYSIDYQSGSYEKIIKELIEKKALLENMLKNIEEKMKKENIENKVTLQSENSKTLSEGIELFLNNKKNDAIKFFEKHKNLSISKSFLGSIEAMKAGEDGDVTKKLQYVENAYKIFDEAEKMAQDEVDKYYLYRNRIEVSKSVPDEIFHKIDIAINDINNMLKLNISDYEKIYYYITLIDLYNTKRYYSKMKPLIKEIDEKFGEKIKKYLNQ